MGAGLLKLIFFVQLLIWIPSSAVVAGMPGLEDRLIAIEQSLASRAVEANQCLYSEADLINKNALLESLTADLGRNSKIYALALSDASLENKELSERSHRLNQSLLPLVQTVELCIFKTKIDAEIKRTGEDPQFKKFREDLLSVSKCLRTSGDGKNASVKKGFSQVFENIFEYFWNKKSSLNDQDCELLKSTYSVWSSFYDDENAILRKENSKGIPLYNVNDHNSSFYYWAMEQNRGRIPKDGLTIFHADTHSDLQHVHNHSYGHWSSDVLTQRDIQKITNLPEAEFKAKFIEMIGNAPDLESQDRIAKVDRVKNTSVEQLKQELDQVTRANVSKIAQPLAAAQLTGIGNGRFIMCMPPWSSELPRTTKDSPIQARFMKQGGGAYGFSLTSAQYQKLKQNHPESAVNFAVNDDEIPQGPAFAQDPDRMNSASQFHVVDCNNEKRTLVNPEAPASDQKWVTRQSDTKLPQLQDFFAKSEEKNGFLLDIDLDAFVSEGHGGVAEPISFERPSSVHNGLPVHGSHTKSSETDPSIQVPSVEYDLIKGRIDSLFSRLQSLKSSGVSPKVITIADSTALKRAMSSRQAGEATGKWSAYTPDCLAFLVNFMTRKKLKEVYPEVDFPGQ